MSAIPPSCGMHGRAARRSRFMAGSMTCRMASCATWACASRDRRTSMTFDEFLADAWAEHGDRPAEVADRIARSTHLITLAQQVDPFARLLAHVFGEHLG